MDEYVESLEEVEMIRNVNKEVQFTYLEKKMYRKITKENQLGI